MSKLDSALERVHNLYVLQFQLFEVLGAEKVTAEQRKEAMARVKQFQKLLKAADHRYMGGDDVVLSLQSLPKEVMAKVKSRRPSVRSVRGKRK